MAAARPSVMEPANAETTRAATKFAYEVAFADQIIEAKKRREAQRNAGRFPKYKAVGTQKKFYTIVSQICPAARLEYPDAEGQNT